MTVAVVAMKSSRGLQFLTEGAPEIRWTRAGHLATRFPDVRSATATALKVAAQYRAFALPTSGLLGVN
jgi:hypothetical protein